MSNYKFIVNPMAAAGKCAKKGEYLRQLSQDEKIDFDLEFTRKRGHATEIARKCCNQFEFIVAVGGDGTINEVVNGLVGGKAKLGIIPAGCGNDLIRSLAIPKSLSEAFKVLMQKKTTGIDIGKVNQLYFINGMGIGFDAWVVKTLLSEKRLYGKLRYLYGIFKSIYQYKPVELVLSYNDISTTEKYFMINIGNGHSMGGGFKLTPMAVVNDGLLDLNIVQHLTTIEIFKNLFKVFSGKHTEMPQVTTARTNYLKVESVEQFAAQIDGEFFPLSMKESPHALIISLLPKAIEIVVAHDRN